MDDYISRKVAIQASELIIGRDTSGENAIVNAMIAWNEYIKGLPSEDVVKVVRCKDCIWWDNSPLSTLTPMHRQCKRVGRMGTQGSDFCSFGERKDG